MSRHEFNFEKMRTVVGWDPPLQTFFIQHGPILSNGSWAGVGPEVWFGTSFREIVNLEQVKYLDGKYTLGLSDPRVLKKLEDDQKYNV